MMDFFYAELQPWKHYVPVKADLSDLKARHEWAEAHQAEARAIAELSVSADGQEGMRAFLEKRKAECTGS